MVLKPEDIKQFGFAALAIGVLVFYMEKVNDSSQSQNERIVGFVTEVMKNCYKVVEGKSEDGP